MLYRRILKPEPKKPTTLRTSAGLSDTARITDILARTIWGEARGENLSGKEAIANVVINRLKIAQKHADAYWWGNSIDTICLKPEQFSCWNESDPNYRPLIAVGADDPNFAVCLRIARRAVQNTLNDNTSGADHYHTENAAPKWSLDRTPVAVIGHHLFYKLEG